LPFLTEQVNDFSKTLKELKQDYSEIGWTITQVINSKDYEVLVWVFQKLKDAGIVFLQVVLALVLSFVFIIDRKKLNKYLGWVKKSNFKFLYHEYNIIFDKIVKSFGLILKAQTMIAFVNAILTIIWLYIIGAAYGIIFPYILTLWLIVFIFGFIPVLGVFLSSIPIAIVAYTTVWWYDIVLAIAVLIVIVHAVEAYYLNPKIVSSFLDFPVSLTFLILIISEHIFWFAWLLIWVSLFYFLMWVLKDIDVAITKKKKKLIKKS
jgi:predicted PurR-regulated permease PerM